MYFYTCQVHKDARRRVPSVTFAEAKTQSYARAGPDETQVNMLEKDPKDMFQIPCE